MELRPAWGVRSTRLKTYGLQSQSIYRALTLQLFASIHGVVRIHVTSRHLTGHSDPSRFAGDRLMATNQGVDHLGPNLPNEAFYALSRGKDYGWPHCYVAGAAIKADPKYPRKEACKNVPAPMGRFDAHASALGFDFFGAANNAQLADEYLVALHGSGSTKLGHGYKIVRMSASGKPLGDFMTGFLSAGKVSGRPCGILRTGNDAFLFTDDKYGVVYYVHPE